MVNRALMITMGADTMWGLRSALSSPLLHSFKLRWLSNLRMMMMMLMGVYTGIGHIVSREDPHCSHDLPHF